MKIITYVAGPIDANNYLVFDGASSEAVLVDCSDYVEDIICDVKKYNLNVKYILLTHGHFDHVLGVNRMAKELDSKVVLNRNDKVLVDNINEFGNIFLGLPELEIPKIDIFCDDGAEFEFCGRKIKVLHTPGHTEGSVCYLIDNKLFSGDTIFKGSYGRTDLFGGDYSKIVRSLKDIILKLDDGIEVYPGHGDPTTISYEKRFNEINT